MGNVSIQTTQYKGSLELFLALVQKSEVNLQDVEVKLLIQQIIPQLGLGLELIDQGADSLKYLGILLLLKSRKLLPEKELDLTGLEEDPSVSLHYLKQIAEYCSFKELGRHLLIKQESSLSSVARPAQYAPKMSAGIEHLSLHDLAKFFQVALSKATPAKGFIEEDHLKVADFMQMIRSSFQNQNKVNLDILFSETWTRMEIIVCFLALLELMKLGEVQVFKDQKTGSMYTQVCLQLHE